MTGGLVWPLYSFSPHPLPPASFPPLARSPGLENPTEGPLSDVANVLDIVPRVLEGQQLRVQQQGNPLVHGVGVKSVQQELRRESAHRRGLHRPVDPKKGLERLDEETCNVVFLLPLSAPPLLPLSAAGEDADDEEDGRCDRGQGDDDDGHGVGRRRHGRRGRGTGGLTGPRGLWLHR